MKPLIETLIFVKLIVYYVSILLKNMDGQLLSLMIKDLSSPLTLTHTSPDASQTRIVKDSGTRLCRICQVSSHSVPFVQNDCSLYLPRMFLHDILRTNTNVTSKPSGQSDLLLLSVARPIVAVEFSGKQNQREFVRMFIRKYPWD